ncbi:MAG: hypothetical protein JW946_00155 [Candidatus Omnitrophica bacterium]|nr:hypothetical protein [Candidatus Omnitrophota bacterium]
MNIALFFTIFTWAIGGLVILYSFSFLKNKRNKLLYFALYTLTLILATAAFNTNDLVQFLVYWGSLLILLYAVLALDSFKTASKALIIVGIGDFCLLLGVAFLIVKAKTTSMADFIPLDTGNFINAAAFMLIALGAMIKAGIFGFHEWITDASQATPATTMAFLPGSLDKLLGIYLLLRAYLNFFTVRESLSVIIMAIGAFTIILTVFMALIQHDLKKLLAFHAVSQVGYMVLGIASGTLIGIAGGLFHMLNNAIYKTALFLNAGNIEHGTGTTELSKIGNLGKSMPVTFVCTLISALAISGIPPFNGFFSKWMIYQGLIPDKAGAFGTFKIIFLIMAMFGSALTLASFIKVIYSAFLSSKPAEQAQDVQEAPYLMRFAVIILSGLCILFGVFAYPMIIKPFFVNIFSSEMTLTGLWKPDIATGLILLALAIGCLIYALSRAASRSSEVFIGGETLKDNRVSGTDFYLTVQDIGFLKFLYKKADAGKLDFYKTLISFINAASYVFYYGIDRLMNFITNAAGKSVFVISAFLKSLHTGLLDRYVAWLLLGFIVIIGVLFKCLNCM